MSHEQKMLRHRIDNTKDAEMSNALKQKHNRLKHAIRRKTLENATTKLDQKMKEIGKHVSDFFTEQFQGDVK